MKFARQLDTLPLYQLCFAFGVLAMVPFLGALQADFVFDDNLAILGNPMVSGDFDFFEVFRRDFWGMEAEESIGSYRPLAVLSFCLDQYIGGGAPWAFHLGNILIHGAASAALFAYAAGRFGRRLAVLATLIFCVHALHTENVAGIVARADVLATALVLVTLNIARMRASRAWLCGLIFFAALLAKEIAVAAIAVLLADLVLGLDPNSEAQRKSRLVSLASMAVAFVVYMVIRQATMGVIAPPVQIQGNPLLDATMAERIYTSFSLLARSFGLMLFPLNLTADYSIPAIMPDTSPFNLGVIQGVLLLLAIVAAMLLLRKKEPAIAWGAAIVLAAFVPVSNLFALVPTIYAERLLYLPSVGFCLVLARAIQLGLAHKRWARPVSVILGMYLVFNVARSATRTSDWYTGRALFTSAVETEPVSLLSRLHLGDEERHLGNLEAAAEQYNQAIALAPNFGNPYTELGITFDLMGLPKEAHELMVRAVRMTPDCAECVAGLVSFYLKYGKFEGARAAIDNLEAVSPEAAKAILELREKLAKVEALHAASRQ